MAIEPLHARLRAAAFNARTNPRLSALLLEAAAAVPRPKGDEPPRRDTMAVLAAHSAAVRVDEEEVRQHGAAARVVEAVAAYRHVAGYGPLATVAEGLRHEPAALASCGHCGEEYVVGASTCPECSGRVA